MGTTESWWTQPNEVIHFNSNDIIKIQWNHRNIVFRRAHRLDPRLHRFDPSVFPNCYIITRMRNNPENWQTSIYSNLVVKSRLALFSFSLSLYSPSHLLSQLKELSQLISNVNDKWCVIVWQCSSLSVDSMDNHSLSAILACMYVYYVYCICGFIVRVHIQTFANKRISFSVSFSLLLLLSKYQVFNRVIPWLCSGFCLRWHCSYHCCLALRCVALCVCVFVSHWSYSRHTK